MKEFFMNVILKSSDRKNFIQLMEGNYFTHS